jgi:DNA processing protein
MTQSALRFAPDEAFLPTAISPWRELGAYEALWSRPGMSFKKLAQLFRDHPEALPSDLSEPREAAEMATHVRTLLREHGVERFGLRIHRTGEYLARLRDARDPVELLYFQGVWELAETRSVAIVGTRKPSEDGRARARRLARALVKDGITVVSGLATGIDTEAHTAAIEAGGQTIGVIGTPLGEYYPRENRALQDQIARSFLLISQVPVFRYAQQTPRLNRLFFPERNLTMSALTEATIIVEAGETSGTLLQARAAIEQGRKLFILDSCFQRGLSWPEKYLARGAIRVRDYEDIQHTLGHEAPAPEA